MHGHESEIFTTTFLMLSAVSFGLILRWLKQPSLVGYILAGLAVGPAGLGLVDYLDEISSLAEFGVILLLFIIGIELSAMAFLRVFATGGDCDAWPDLLLYFFGAFGECLFHLDIAANPAD
jgi:monovalent cation:H+ antiporter-2, CPA2 family